MTRKMQKECLNGSRSHWLRSLFDKHKCAVFLVPSFFAQAGKKAFAVTLCEFDFDSFICFVGLSRAQHIVFKQPVEMHFAGMVEFC